jgi:hypothetical protein
VAGLLLLQLTGILWWQSRALALRNYEMRLRDKIALTGQQVAQTKHRISQLDSKGNLAHTASQMGWQVAPVSSLDDITNRRRITPQETAAIGSSQESPDAQRVVIVGQGGSAAKIATDGEGRAGGDD